MFEGSYIIKMSYIDDVCYVTLANLKTYRSQDLSTWEEIYDGIGVPISNGETTIYTTIENDPNATRPQLFQNPILSKDFKPDKNVAVEGIDMRTTDVCGRFFINYHMFLFQKTEFIGQDLLYLRNLEAKLVGLKSKRIMC